MNSRDWIPPNRLRTMEEESRRSDDVRRSGRIWQNFDRSVFSNPGASVLSGKVLVHDRECSAASLLGSGTDGKVFFCSGCENKKEESRFCREDTEFSPSNAYPDRCIGCAFKHAHYNSFYRIKTYAEIRESESYSLACAYHIYVNDLQDLRPRTI